MSTHKPQATPVLLSTCQFCYTVGHHYTVDCPEMDETDAVRARQDVKPYDVLCVSFEPEHTEQVVRYYTSTYREALVMAEQQDAGLRTRTYGIPTDSYAAATAEGIAFNLADGLLLDEDC